MSRRGGGARRAADPEVRDDAGDRAQLGAPRLRPARVHARRRRRRAARCSRATSPSSSRSPACSSRRYPGHRRRPPGCSPPTSQHEFVATERHAARATSTRRGSQRRFDGARGAGDAPSSTPTACPDDGGSSGGSPTAATPARATRCASTCPPAPSTTPGSRTLKERFHAAHEAEYGHRFEAADRDHQRPRASAIGRVDELQPDGAGARATATRPRARTLEREVVFDVDGKPERTSTPFYERERLLRRRHASTGPAVIEQYDSTTVVPPGLGAEIDRLGNIVIDCTTAVRDRGADARARAWPRRSCMRVIGGAFAAIAKEMAGVLYRMSYSSIIRESEDLGAGIFDARRATSWPSRTRRRCSWARCRRSSRTSSRSSATTSTRATSSSTTTRTAAPRTRRTSRSSIPIFFDGRARRLLRRVGARPRHRRRLSRAWPSTSSTTGRRGTSTARSSSRRRASGRRALWKHIIENVRTPTLNNGDIRGDDRGLRAGQAALPRAPRAATARRRCSAPPTRWLDYSERMLRHEIAKVPDGGYETDVGWLDDDGRQPRRAAAGQGRGRDRRRRDHLRPDRLERRGRRPASTARSRARPSRR